MEQLTELERRAVLARLIDQMDKSGSWNGETHIQKAVYFLQTATGVPTNLGFVLYKHGPYSFDLHDELVWMKADQFIGIRPKYPYGPSFHLAELGSVMLSRFPKMASRFTGQIKFVANEFCEMQVVELERLATAWFVTVNHPADPEKRASTVNSLKPHITLEEARSAIQRVDDIAERAKQFKHE